MRSSFEYLAQHNLMLVQWAGNWDIEEYKKSIAIFSEAIKDIKVEKVLHDIRNLDFNLNHDVILQLTKIRENKFNKDFEVVYITDQPNHVVFSELYSHQLPRKGSHQYCTTLATALKILSLNLREIELENKLQNLSKGMND